MNLLVFGLVALLLTPVPQERPLRDAETSVGLLCGRLFHVDYIPDKDSPNTSTVKEKSLRKIPLYLYSWHENEICCEGLSPVADTLTGRWGQFKFKKASPRKYWLVARFGGREYKMVIRYQPSNTTDIYCSQLAYTIENSGRFVVGRTITVD